MADSVPNRLPFCNQQNRQQANDNNTLFHRTSVIHEQCREINTASTDMSKQFFALDQSAVAWTGDTFTNNGYIVNNMP